MTDWPFVHDAPVSLDDQQLQHAEQVLRDTLLGSGAVSLAHFRQPIAVDNKLADGFDPVTEADRACERFIDAQLRERLPDHGLFGEEHGYRPGDSGLTWVVDPIDGTRSYICGIPLWGTLMALFDGRDVVLGGLYQPWSDELFIGSRLGGRFCRGGKELPLQTANTTRLDQAKLCCTTLDIFEDPAELAAFKRLAGQCRLLRQGTDCYAYVMLAQGGVDLVVESGLNPHDIQALIPIIEAAGGVITDWDGGSAALGGAVVAAATPALHRAALQVLS